MKYVALVISLAIMAYLVMEFNARTAELNRLRAEQELVARRLEERQATLSAYQAQISYATSEAAVLKWAYENHMARPGDVVVAPVEPGQATPTPAPTATPPPPPKSNFERWLALFLAPPE